jgi:hypothetical protein
MGFRVEEFGSSGSAGAYPSMKLLPMFRRERPERGYSKQKREPKHFPVSIPPGQARSNGRTTASG